MGLLWKINYFEKDINISDMEEVKYILGDLVSPDGSIAKIISIAPGLGKGNIEIGFSNGWHFTAYYKDFTDAILGILLTPEILEKNGWNKEPSENVTWYKYRTDKSSLYICKDSFNKKDWLVCVALDKHYIANINYVHQLQHLLFGLGLNLEMEV